MQPPPRKVKPNVALKNTHTDQVSKLQAKHQQECDLLEDIRTFFLRKSALEKEYAQGLLKLTSQLLKREFPAQPDISTEDGLEHKTVCTVWRSILEESDRLAKARLTTAEIYSEKAAEPLKPTKAGKAQCCKKVLPQMGTIQAEVAQCVSDLVKAQKNYNTEGSVAHEARQKSSEAEDKLKRKSTGIFQSLASLQKQCAKLRSRTEASEVKETAMRNEYVLSLAAANAHHIRYYSTDLPDLMKTLDCDVYEKIQEALTVAGQTAADIAEAESRSFQNIATEAAKICREFSHQCYLFQNPVFTNLVQYQFEPCNGDTCNKVSSDHGAGPELEKEARKWSTKVAKETRSIRDYYRQMTILQNGRSIEKSPDSGSQESTSVDPETKMEEVKQSIRKAETAKLKAEARLEVLRLGGVNVDEWINQAQMESLVADEKGLARTPSQVSLRTESSGGHSATDDHEGAYTNYDDDDDFIDDTFNTSGNRSGRTYPIFCKALYDFEASNYDEMTIKGNEDLELIADGDGEGWVKAKNSLGQEGYIPETYVDLGGLSAAPAPLGVEAMNAINESSTTSTSTIVNNEEGSAPAATSPQEEVDTHQDNSDHQESQPSTEGLTSPDLQSPTSIQFPPDSASPYSSGDLEVQQTTGLTTPQAPAGAETTWARALYDYEAQADEELSFSEGALIHVLRKDDNGVDDGFWEGECQGHRGVFPSLVVEEIMDPAQATADPLSPGVKSLPPDVPPPVHVTLPTPDAEPPPPPSLANGEAVICVPVASSPAPDTTDGASLPSTHHSHQSHSQHPASFNHPQKHSHRQRKSTTEHWQTRTINSSSTQNHAVHRKSAVEGQKYADSQEKTVEHAPVGNINQIQSQLNETLSQLNASLAARAQNRHSGVHGQIVTEDEDLAHKETTPFATKPTNDIAHPILAEPSDIQPSSVLCEKIVVVTGNHEHQQSFNQTSNKTVCQTNPVINGPVSVVVEETPTITCPVAISHARPTTPNKSRPTTPTKPHPMVSSKPRPATPSKPRSITPTTPTNSRPVTPTKFRPVTPTKPSFITSTKPRATTPTVTCPVSPTIIKPQPGVFPRPTSATPTTPNTPPAVVLPQSPSLSCPPTPLRSLASSYSSLSSLDSQSIPTSATADQSPKRVRFCNKETKDRQMEKHQDPIPPTPKHGRQGSNGEQHPSRLKLLQWMHQKQQQQQQQKAGGSKNGPMQSKPVPILRHKSLPTSLNSRCEKVNHNHHQTGQTSPVTPMSSSLPIQQEQQQQGQSPLSPRKHVGISNQRTRSSESVVSRTPPATRRHPPQQPQRKPVKEQEQSRIPQQKPHHSQDQNRPKGQGQSQEKMNQLGQSTKGNTNASRQRENLPNRSQLSPKTQCKELAQNQRRQNHPPQSPKTQRGADSPKLRSPNPKHKPSRQDLALSFSSQQKSMSHKSPSSPTSPSRSCRARPLSPLTIPPSSPSHQYQHLPPPAPSVDRDADRSPNFKPHEEQGMQQHQQQPSPQGLSVCSDGHQKQNQGKHKLQHLPKSTSGDLKKYEHTAKQQQNNHREQQHQQEQKQQQHQQQQHSPQALSDDPQNADLRENHQEQQIQHYQQQGFPQPDEPQNNHPTYTQQQNCKQQYQQQRGLAHTLSEDPRDYQYAGCQQQQQLQTSSPSFSDDVKKYNNIDQQQLPQPPQYHHHHHHVQNSQQPLSTDAKMTMLRPDESKPQTSWLSPVNRQNLPPDKNLYGPMANLLVNRGILCVTTATVYDSWDSEDGEESLV